MGEGLAEAAIVRWLVPEGGVLVRMEPMVEIETAKSTVEIPSPVDGVLVSHGAPEGDTVEVGTVLAVLETADARAVEVGGDRVARPSRDGAGRVPAAPTVRRRAAQHGADLSEVPATGPGGRVLAADLEAFLAGRGTSSRPAAAPVAIPATAAVEPSPPGAGHADRVEPLSRMRRGIASALHRAWSEVPLITDLRDADAEGLVRARRSLQEERGGARVSYTALFAAAALSALRAHPRFNASLDLDAGMVRHHSAVGLGIAVAVPDGLTVAVVHDAASLTLAALAEAIDDVAGRARAGRLTAAETTGATFTVSNYGQFGGRYGTPLVVPPQVAIAGFGPIADAVVAVDGVPAVRKTVALSISADHRLIDGAELSVFCSQIERLIADPIRLLAG
ncbi:2-oxoglutarate dehydrogenase complex dihydrolipoyllysine-residue succinyltransferase [Herbiconiux moechotypicola]|uniref:Dihydrolipoamide acetyltransferase component of pyruvate dehydrogenase complex n=1 Tax=Herbiconiux moechotypicola TaxID=637393 RepID=A0ABP5Q8E8_9MICO